jgi:hypothetical protein
VVPLVAQLVVDWGCLSNLLVFVLKELCILVALKRLLVPAPCSVNHGGVSGKSGWVGGVYGVNESATELHGERVDQAGTQWNALGNRRQTVLDVEVDTKVDCR